jgi:putative inorganic carbon (HCO3(-)) transporter
LSAHGRAAPGLPVSDTPAGMRATLIGLAGAALAIGAGAAYAVTAYKLSPAVLPLAAAAVAALAVGLWRLELGIALLLLLTPFAENAPISQPGAAKLRLALIAWAGALALAQTARVAVSGEKLRAPPGFTAALLFLGAGLLAVPTAIDQPGAAAKFLLLVGSVVLYLLIGMFLIDWRKVTVLLWALVLLGFIISVHAIFQYLTGQFSRVGFISSTGAVEYRIASVFPHPNALAGFLAIIVPMAICLVGYFKSLLAKVFCSIVAILATIAVVLTFSRGALVALIALPVVLVRDRRAWPFIAVALAAIVLLAPGIWRDRVAQSAQTDRPEIATRLDFWQAAGTMFRHHPLLGVGLNSFAPAYIALERPGRTFLGGGFLNAPETAHNVYLTVLAEQGLIGITGLIVLFGTFLAMMNRLRGSPDPRVRVLGLGLLGSLVVLLVHNFFDVTFADPKSSTLVWVLFGIAAIATRLEQVREPAPAG